MGTDGGLFVALAKRYDHFVKHQPVTTTNGDATLAAIITGKPVVTENEEKNGVEIRFPSKPAEETLTALKANGWRWSRFSGCWYKTRTAESKAFAAELAKG